jgi:adenylate cyclase
MGLIVALGSGYLFVAWLTFANHGAWLPIMVPLGWQMPLAMITSISLNYRRQTRRGETMKSVMDRFIPSDVFHHLTGQEDQGTLPNYGRNATGVCLATDAGRYTALAEVMEPMALAQLMNDYYAAIFEPVTRHGGWISDVIGDAMLAVWIVEHDSGKARHQALAAAQEIREAVRRFEKQHGLVFPIRMGLHYGELRFGYVGTADRGEIRAVGDTVNTATRLEGLNKLLGSQILVSSQLLENLEFDRVRPVGEFLLPGKARPVSVAELLADNETAACPPELLARFREALTLFDESQWSEAYSAFTLLNLQFPEDGPTRFYQKTAGLYLTNPPDSQANPAILVEKSDPPRLSAQP